MASPGFGFSAGDFVAALKLIVDVSKALKDVGGAADEYRQVVAELQLLQKVIQQLQSRDTDPASRLNVDDAFNTYAQQQAGLTLNTLAGFLEFISKFDAKLGLQAQAGWFRGAGRKAQWAVIHAREVEKLRSRVGAQLQFLNLLVQLQEQPTILHSKIDKVLASQTEQTSETARIKEESVAEFNAIAEAIRHLQTSQTAEFASCSLDTARVLEAHGTNFYQMLSHIKTSQTGADAQTHALMTMTGQVLENQKHLERGLRSCTQMQGECLDILARRRDPVLRAISDSHNRLSDSIGRVQEVVESSASMRQPQLHPKLPIQKASYQPAEVVQTDQNKASDLEEVSELDEFCELVVKLLRVLVTALKHIIQKAWILFPHLHTIMSTLATVLAREPMLLLSDSIMFEDVLGRKFALQYEFYKHWEIFEGFLQRQFQSLPGEYQVLSGQFLILDSGPEERVILKHDWTQVIRRGTMIFMSVRVGPQVAIARHCLRSDCWGEMSKNIFPTRVTQECKRRQFKYFVIKGGSNTVPKQESLLVPVETSAETKERQDICPITNRTESGIVFRSVHLFDTRPKAPNRGNFRKAKKAEVENKSLFGSDFAKWSPSPMQDLFVPSWGHLEVWTMSSRPHQRCVSCMRCGAISGILHNYLHLSNPDSLSEVYCADCEMELREAWRVYSVNGWGLYPKRLREECPDVMLRRFLYRENRSGHWWL